jgi:hypothetical protein
MKHELAAILLAAGMATASPFAHQSHKREVPQEHSHNRFLDLVRTSLNLNNPKQIQDPVFGLLGNAAAAGGAGKVTNLDCLQQETADQAFTNAKAANDAIGMAGALVYRALERNTGKVGLASVICTETAVNPEIAAISQHQDPASANAASVNKGITLALAKQLALIGVDPNLALESGTFAPGSVRFHSSTPMHPYLIFRPRRATIPGKATAATLLMMSRVVSSVISSLSSTLPKKRLSPPWLASLPLSPRPESSAPQISISRVFPSPPVAATLL